MGVPETLRRAAVAVGLAGGLIGGVVGVGHAFAATSSPSAKSGAHTVRSSSSHHNCPNMGRNSSSSTTATAFGL